MRVEVKKGDVTYYCTSEEQLALFLADGYEETKADEPPKKAPATKKTTK